MYKMPLESIAVEQVSLIYMLLSKVSGVLKKPPQLYHAALGRDDRFKLSRLAVP